MDSFSYSIIETASSALLSWAAVAYISAEKPL